MQENVQPPRHGLETLVAGERRVLASFKEVRTLPVETFFVDGDRSVIRWVFEFVRHDGQSFRQDELAYQRWEGDGSSRSASTTTPRRRKRGWRTRPPRLRRPRRDALGDGRRRRPPRRCCRWRRRPLPPTVTSLGREPLRDSRPSRTSPPISRSSGAPTSRATTSVSRLFASGPALRRRRLRALRTGRCATSWCGSPAPRPRRSCRRALRQDGARVRRHRQLDRHRRDGAPLLDAPRRSPPRSRSSSSRSTTRSSGWSARTPWCGASPSRNGRSTAP